MVVVVVYSRSSSSSTAAVHDTHGIVLAVRGSIEPRLLATLLSLLLSLSYPCYITAPPRRRGLRVNDGGGRGKGRSLDTPRGVDALPLPSLTALRSNRLSA